MSGYGDGNFGEGPYGGAQPEEFDIDAFEKEIENWTKGVSQEARSAFASQCAARVLPNIGGSVRPKDFTGFSFDLILIRASLTSAVAGTIPTADVKAAAASANSAANSAAASAFSTASAASAAASAASANSAAFSAAASAFSANSAAASANSAASAASARSAAEVLNQSAPKALFEHPLWLGVTWPDTIANNWATLRGEWSSDPAMAFWIDWYEGLLAGRTPDWDLWHDIVLIDDELWKTGPEAVAREIERVKSELRDRRAVDAEQNEDPKPISQQQATLIFQNKATIALNAVALQELYREFYESIRVRNSLEEQEREDLLSFCNNTIEHLETLKAHLSNFGAEPNIEDATKVASWATRYKTAISKSFGQYISPDNVAGVTVPSTIILISTAIGAACGSAPAGAIVGGLITNHMKPDKAVGELLKADDANVDAPE